MSRQLVFRWAECPGNTQMNDTQPTIHMQRRVSLSDNMQRKHTFSNNNPHKWTNQQHISLLDVILRKTDKYQ